MYLKKIKLIVLDIDGVMTNGKKIYSKNGVVTGKEYNDKDFSAINTLKGLGYDVIFLSGDTRINDSMAKDRKIEIYYSRNKLEKLDEILQFYGLTEKEVLYVGDDIPDLPVLDVVGVSVCPYDAPNYVKRVVDCVTPSKGGEGVVADVLDCFIVSTNKRL